MQDVKVKRSMYICILVIILTINVSAFAEELSVDTAGQSGYLSEIQNQKSGGALENILLIAFCVFIIYFLYIKPSKTKSKRAIDGKNTQDLLYYDEIEDDGLIILPDNRYRRMLEISPTNISIKSPNEQATIWEEYRNTIDNISVNWTQVVQTRIVRFKDYVDIQTKRNNELKSKFPQYPKLYQHQNLILEQMINEYEKNEHRERKYFIILKVDADELMNADSSLSSSNGFMSMLTKTFSTKKKNKYDDKDLRTISESELNNAAVLIKNGLIKTGIGAQVLNKYGIYDYLNHTYNRDLAYVQDVEEAIRDYGVLSPVKKSTTVDNAIDELTLDLTLNLAFVNDSEITSDSENKKTENEVNSTND